MPTRLEAQTIVSSSGPRGRGSTTRPIGALAGAMRVKYATKLRPPWRRHPPCVGAIERSSPHRARVKPGRPLRGLLGAPTWRAGAPSKRLGRPPGQLLTGPSLRARKAPGARRSTRPARRTASAASEGRRSPRLGGARLSWIRPPRVLPPSPGTTGPGCGLGYASKVTEPNCGRMRRRTGAGQTASVGPCRAASGWPAAQRRVRRGSSRDRVVGVVDERVPERLELDR